MILLTGFNNNSFLLSSNYKIDSNNTIFSLNDPYTFQWNVTLNGNASSTDEGYGIAMDSQGYIYVSGIVYQTTNWNDIILIKYDQSGNVYWNRTISSNGIHKDCGYDLDIDNNDNIYVVGYLYDPINSDDFILLKYNTNGTLLWNKTWGGGGLDRIFGVDFCNNHLYVVGKTSSWGTGQNDLVVEKLDLSGNRIWNYTWGGSYDDSGNGIYVKGNDIYVTGSTSDSTQDDVVIIRLYDLGSICSQMWVKIWGGSHEDQGYDIAVDTNNSVYITGLTESIGLGEDNAFLLKYDHGGNNIWNRTWGDSLSDFAHGISIDQNNNIFITGKTESNALDNYWDIFIVQYDINGNQPWYTVWHGGMYHYGYDVLTHNNDIYLTGEVQYIGGVDRNILLLKYSKTADTTTTPIPGFDFPIAILSMALIFGIYMIYVIFSKRNNFSKLN
ncbi:MAG: hypothetical protein GF329_22755 [Candidatus Lokiarchaeota archaeon]|nr:hypothetical protein [Candidatus Lokiarchaeota archaeon]